MMSWSQAFTKVPMFMPRTNLAPLLRTRSLTFSGTKELNISFPRQLSSSICRAKSQNFIRNSSKEFCCLDILQPSSSSFPSSWTRSRGLHTRGYLCCMNGKQFLCIVKPILTSYRHASSRHGTGMKKSNQTALIYTLAIFIFMLGGAYAGVPLYRIFCQATGLGGRAIRDQNIQQIEDMKKVDRQIRIRFNADVASSMRWSFRPQQTEVTVLPGETALAFYTAENPTDKPIIGISTYNILPFDAGQYFNKIQCFCFEEQRLNPKEQVDMPVFFYIDPEFADDPKLEHVDTITLSYTFFEAREGLQLPLPGYPQPHDPIVAQASA